MQELHIRRTGKVHSVNPPGKRPSDTRFVNLGRYLCEVRAGQYWRLENLSSFDDFLERRFPESRRKAYYLMSIHEHLPKPIRQDLKQLGWSKAIELVKIARRDGQRFESATWLHKAQSLPKEQFKAEVERELTGRESEPSELMYFKVYKSQAPVIEQAIDTAALMLGSDKARGYCLEMICADFLAGAQDRRHHGERSFHAATGTAGQSPAPPGRAGAGSGKGRLGQTAGAGRYRGLAVHKSFHSYVAEVAEVSMAPDGAPRVHRVVCAVDCGLAVNPRGVEAQMQSGIVFGLSAALKGRITIDKGHVQQSNFDDYPVLRIDEMPKIEVYIVPSDQAPTGTGEPGAPAIAPAVVNAVSAAIGKRVRKLPLL